MNLFRQMTIDTSFAAQFEDGKGTIAPGIRICGKNQKEDVQSVAGTTDSA
jgi:hypothetical protein